VVRVDLDPPIRLTRPDVALHRSWLESAAEFAAEGTYQHGSGLTPQGEQPRLGGPAWRPAELTDPDRFAAFVAHLLSLEDPDVVRPLGMVPDSKLWITSPDAEPRYLGALSLRHELNEFLLEQGGHIGYSVRPSARGRGIATRALWLALGISAELGIDRVLVTCEQDNPASARTIERCGGVLEDERRTLRRYWIELARA